VRAIADSPSIWGQIGCWRVMVVVVKSLYFFIFCSELRYGVGGVRHG